MALKKIAEEVNLTDKLDTITAMEFRKSPGEVFAQVALGKTFIITVSDKPVAVLSRLPGLTLSIVVSRKGKMAYSL